MTRLRNDRLFWIFVLVVAAAGPTRASEPEGKAADDPARSLFAKHCQACHAGLKPKGDFRVDSLSRDFNDRANRERWLTVLEQITTGTMPPKEKPRPAAQEVQSVTAWIRG